MEKSAADLLASPGVSSLLKSLKLKTKQQELLIRVSVLFLVYVLAFITRLFSILRYESMIHEFDPYFNYRVTQFLTRNGFYEFWNWFDYESWYPLGRIVGGTLYPGLMVTAAFIYWTLRFLRYFLSANSSRGIKVVALFIVNKNRMSPFPFRFVKIC